MASGGALALPEMAKPLQSKTFKFLFIGGALPRKGIDLLLRAFVETFSTHDDVSLIVHSIYGDEFKTHVMEALETQYDKYPEIVFLKQELTWVDMVLLYRSVDIYVCPYRNEGFGLTIVEAMANGLPIIITKGGPAAEICEDDHTFWVDAEWTRCRDVKPCEANGTKIFGEELAVPAAW
jgi:glycosyltransferase involved in cell wall biosynthesis